MKKFLLIALVACSLGFQLQYVASEKAVREPAVNDAINDSEMNDFEARQDIFAGPSDEESEDLENEEENTEDEVDEEPAFEDEGKEETEEMDDEDGELQDEDDDYTDDDVDEDEDLNNRYLEISSCYNKPRKMNAVSVNERPC